MITIVAKSVIKEGKKEEFMALTKELIEKSRAEVGCLAYDLYEDIKNPNVVAFIERWQDMKTIAAHNKSPHFTSIVPKLGGLREGEMEITLYKQL